MLAIQLEVEHLNMHCWHRVGVDVSIWVLALSFVCNVGLSLSNCRDHTERERGHCSVSYKIIHFKCSLSHSRQHSSYGGLTTFNTSTTSTSPDTRLITFSIRHVKYLYSLVWFCWKYWLVTALRRTIRKMAITGRFHCNKCDKRFS